MRRYRGAAHSLYLPLRHRNRRFIPINPNTVNGAIARSAPRRWRTDAALKRAGFRPVRGGLKDALRASRLARLTRELAAARRRSGMTQAEVARLIGTTASAVSRMESDHPGNLTIATIDRYARAVNAELLLAVRPVKPIR